MMREALHDIRDDPTAAQSRVSAWIHVLAKIRQHSSTFLMVLAAAQAGIDERMDGYIIVTQPTRTHIPHRLAD